MRRLSHLAQPVEMTQLSHLAQPAEMRQLCHLAQPAKTTVSFGLTGRSRNETAVSFGLVVDV